MYDQVVDALRRGDRGGLARVGSPGTNGIGFSKSMVDQAKRAWRGDSRTETQALLVRAQASLHRALERNPRNAMVLGNLGYAAFLLGDREKARQHLQSAIAIGGDRFALRSSLIRRLTQFRKTRGFAKWFGRSRGRSLKR